jgi:hypothetical protein
MLENCARCGRKVKAEENWLKAHLWASTAVFHWSCFTALMELGKREAELARTCGIQAECWASTRGRTSRS